MRIAALVCLFFAASPALASDFGPWSLGMSAEQIKAVSSHGPYKAFSNGDLETYNGDFGGNKENVQFFLKADRLWRIGVYTYEGTDLAAATEAWTHTFTKHFSPNTGRLKPVTSTDQRPKRLRSRPARS